MLFLSNGPLRMYNKCSIPLVQPFKCAALRHLQGHTLREILDLSLILPVLRKCMTGCRPACDIKRSCVASEIIIEIAVSLYRIYVNIASLTNTLPRACENQIGIQQLEEEEWMFSTSFLGISVANPGRIVLTLLRMQKNFNTWALHIKTSEMLGA